MKREFRKISQFKKKLKFTTKMRVAMLALLAPWVARAAKTCVWRVDGEGVVRSGWVSRPGRGSVI